jgi:hypothetical protein
MREIGDKKKEESKKRRGLCATTGCGGPINNEGGYVDGPGRLTGRVRTREKGRWCDQACHALCYTSETELVNKNKKMNKKKKENSNGNRAKRGETYATGTREEVVAVCGVVEFRPLALALSVSLSYHSVSRYLRQSLIMLLLLLLAGATPALVTLGTKRVR